MIAVDTQILVYAHRSESPFHNTALKCLIDLANSPTPWAIPWSCVHEFLGIVTRPKLFDPPSSMTQALAAMEVWRQSPSLLLLSEQKDHLTHLTSILIASRVAGARVHDARIAAICLSHGVSQLWTADRDFSLFPNLAVRNPLAGSE